MLEHAIDAHAPGPHVTSFCNPVGKLFGFCEDKPNAEVQQAIGAGEAEGIAAMAKDRAIHETLKVARLAENAAREAADSALLSAQKVEQIRKILDPNDAIGIEHRTEETVDRALAAVSGSALGVAALPLALLVGWGPRKTDFL